MLLMTVALSIDRLVKRYGKLTALNEISFSVEAGQVTALLGPNGAGKTTLFQILTGLFVADSGQVSILGIDIAKDPVAALKQLGIVFQQSALDPDLTAHQNLIFHGGLHGLSRKDATARADKWLQNFGLSDVSKKPCRQLSGGMKRRVELARALMTDPALLLLDEPTQGLDPKSRKELVETVFALARDRGLSVVWATHLVGEVVNADTIIVLDHGHIVGKGTSPELLIQTKANSLEDAFLALTEQRHEGHAA
jgi:ABC-2 type transport system ATP-binding protein